MEEEILLLYYAFNAQKVLANYFEEISHICSLNLTKAVNIAWPCNAFNPNVVDVILSKLTYSSNFLSVHLKRSL